MVHTKTRRCCATTQRTATPSCLRVNPLKRLRRELDPAHNAAKGARREHDRPPHPTHRDPPTGGSAGARADGSRVTPASRLRRTRPFRPDGASVGPSPTGTTAMTLTEADIARIA